MLTAQGGQLAARLIVLGNEARPQEERFCHLGNCSGRQSEPAGDDVEPRITLGENSQVLLLDRPQPQRVDSFQQTSTLKMLLRDRGLALTATDTTTGLQKPQSQPRRAARSLGDLAEDFPIDAPSQ